ncbi:MAG: GNAT family N-acetyltransferase [bacterium]
MINYGLKLWSINENYIDEAQRLYKENIYSYIELYAVPNSIDLADKWAKLNIPIVIHAPHFEHGLNLSIAECFENNIKLLNETFKFADKVNADTIILHSGMSGKIEESINQLNKINDPRLIIENKPFKVKYNNLNCVGYTPEQIKLILDNTDKGFCFDIGHGICSSNHREVDIYEDIKQYLKLNPKMFHFTDGESNGIYDKHLNFGNGDYDINKIIRLLPENIALTIETIKNSKENLDDFAEDIKYLMKKTVPTNLEYKLAEEADVDKIFSIANDPVVRQNSLNQDYIDYDTHVSWFKSKLEDKNSPFFIINYKKEFVGYVRFDKESNTNNYVVTTHLIKKYRGIGIGSKSTEYLSNKLLTFNKNAVITAYVKTTNDKSIKSFLSADYNFIEKLTINDNLCFKLQFNYR